jgi:hypothetical protein
VADEFIDRQREQFRPVASHTTKLYFAIRYLQLINAAYNFSLQWFLSICREALVEALLQEAPFYS